MAEEAIDVARAAHALSEEALGLGILGWAEAVTGDVERGIATYREGLAIAERLGGVEGIALGHANLAALLDRVGRTEDSLAAGREGYAITQRLGVARTYGGALLGHVAKGLFDLGRWDEAAAAADEGLELDPVGAAAIWLHVNRARVDTNQGRFAEAADTSPASRSACRRRHRSRPARRGAGVGDRRARGVAGPARRRPGGRRRGVGDHRYDGAPGPRDGLARLARAACGRRCRDVRPCRPRRRRPARGRAASGPDRRRAGGSRRRHHRRRPAPDRPGRTLSRRDRSRPRDVVHGVLGPNRCGLAGDRSAGADRLRPLPLGGGAAGRAR